MTNYKKILVLLIVLSVIVFGVGFIILYPEKLNICYGDNSLMQECWDHGLAYKLGQPLSIIPLFPFLIFLLLLFCPKKYFDAWKWFALSFGLLSLILIIIAPAQGGGIISIDKETISWATSSLFCIISLIIILTRLYLHSRNKKVGDK